MNHTNIKTINIEELNNHIVSNLDSKSNTITVVNFIIGSYVHPSDFNNPNPKYKRNHEFPEFVKKLLYNPELQFSPEFNSSLTSHTELTIRQVLVLIDSSYLHHPELHGLLSEISVLQPDLTITNLIEHNEFRNTKVISKLEPVVIPCDILEEQVESLLKIIKSLRQFYSIIVNIMDCSSRVLNKMFIDRICDSDESTESTESTESNESNYESWIHLTKPECLILDDKLQYNPIITIDNTFESQFAYKKPFNIRWCNYKDDSKLLDDLKTVYDVCPYSRNTYNFITTLYKVSTLEYMVFGIFKLWGFTTYTMDYHFDFENGIPINNNSHNPNPNPNPNSNPNPNIHNIHNNDIIVNFSKLSFEEFSRYWMLQKGFKELPIFNYDYDIKIICKFIDYFVNKYRNKTGISYLGINPSIVDFLKLETYEIFENLAKYNDNNNKYFENIKKEVNDNTDSNIDSNKMFRNIIKNYLEDNHIVF